MKRVPQQDRSTATRAKVLDAAVDVLLELGYANTTTALVADRAGVSRGAMQYHFRTRAELLAAAVEHLADHLIADVERAAAELPPPDGADRIAAVIDLVWSSFSAPLAVVWHELNVASRTDGELDALLDGLRERLTATIRERSYGLFGANRDDHAAGLFIEMTLAMLSGLIVARGTGIGGKRRPRREAELMAAWKAVASRLLAELESDASSPSPLS